jgi:hypothetical protein
MARRSDALIYILAGARRDRQEEGLRVATPAARANTSATMRKRAAAEISHPRSFGDH